MKIQDAIAIVTGGSSGLGEACVRLIGSGGGRAAIFDLQDERGQRLAAEMGPGVVFAHCDVTKEESVKAAIQKTLEAFGGINVAVNCAGGGWAEKVASKNGPASLVFFSQVVQTNLVGTFNVIRLAVQEMLKRAPGESGERGVIVSTSSAAAFDGQIGQAAYSASKAGIVGMTLPIARECGEYGIRVMTVAPGVFDTPMMAVLPQEKRDAITRLIPFPKRLGYPSEFAALVGHIIENQMLSGEVIRLDGGVRMAAR